MTPSTFTSDPSVRSDSFWSRSANMAAVFTFFLPLLLGMAAWGIKVEVEMAQFHVMRDQRTDQIAQLRAGVDSSQHTVEDISVRLGRLEGKTDTILQLLQDRKNHP